MFGDLQNIQNNQIPTNPLKHWRALFEQKNLEIKEITQYFQICAPFFISVTQRDGNSLGESSCTFDEDAAKSAIINLIEEFICGEKSEEILSKLRTGNNSSTVCGRVFKNGEPTYSCRECSVDATCVLCASCFKKSSHRYHKYKMSTSMGGGCCDCGDVEAWKKDFCCEDHMTNQSSSDNPQITDQMKDMCYIMFRAVLQYCIKSLQTETDATVTDDIDHQEDVYCTILYNDETHTFDQVIQTLKNVVGCSDKEAVDYVTSIDREGRAVIKCAPFEYCHGLKQDIEKRALRTTLNPKLAPLKVAIFHKRAVACQAFALQLLTWFQDFLALSSVFRKIFSEIVLQHGTPYHLKQILLYDIKLWKSARTAWHRLLIAGMLMEYENKKELAIVFTKAYTNIMQDYIRDDHYHTYSIVSLSVQLFTVPTIAHHLIAHELSFFKLMHTYFSECIQSHVKNKVLQFVKNASSNNVFKRASYIITDLKYMLTMKPDVWTQELRSGFLHGVQILMRLLNYMQGMDAVTRQVGQHMEYEPEWESAFTLHIKLAPLITSVIEWCGTDKVVLVKVYRMVLAALIENRFIVSQCNHQVKELCDHSASCLMYDVSAKSVSIHLPLSRFLAGLYLHFEKFGLTFDNVSTTNDKPTPEQLIEPVLCARTMISQVYSGMWRRNGYSLINQLYFYRNVKCRSEMLDRDIVLLQIGASLIENNEYLIHFLNKFDLLRWLEPDFEPNNVKNPEEDNTRQIVNMIDEFLELLIIIIGERYVPGIAKITDEDRVKKEVIQQLCIKPFTHSELNKSLNDEYGNANDFESVIDDVAVFERKSTAEKKRVYKLKEEFYDDYNMYFYHYTKEEKSKSEEAQRQRRKSKNDLVCCPPPKLPVLNEPFNMIANLLQCDVMLLIMQTVLKRSLDLKSVIFSESHLQKTLHLIGYALQEEESYHYPFLTFLERSNNWNILPLMEELVTNVRVDSQRDLLKWTIKKFKDVSKRHNKIDVVAEAPLTSDPQVSSEKAMKEERAKMAAKRREQLLAQMQKAQKNFISSNAELFDNIDENAPEESSSMDWQPSIEEIQSQACIGSRRKMIPGENEMYTCILCSEEASISKDIMVYPAFVQKSSVLSRFQVTNDVGQLQGLETTIHPSPHVSTCGHVMHATCWQEYFNNERLKETRRPFRNRTPTYFNIDKNEYLCPLCLFLSNSVLPLIPSLNNLYDFKVNSFDNFTFETWFSLMSTFVEDLKGVENYCPDCETRALPREVNEKYDRCIIKFLTEKYNFTFNGRDQEQDIQNLGNVGTQMESFVKTICEVAPYPSASKTIEDYVISWLSCAYTIEALEMYLRATSKSLKGEMSVRFTKCISGLVRLCGLLGSSKVNERTDCGVQLTVNYSSLLLYTRELYDSILCKKMECVLQWDIFGLLVSLIFTTRAVLFAKYPQYTIPRGDSLEHTIFISMFVTNLVKIILTVDLMVSDEMEVDQEEASTSANQEPEDQTMDDVSNRLLYLYQNYNIYTANEENAENATRTPARVTQRSPAWIKRRLLEEMKSQSSTFLRCSAILFRFMTDVDFPDDFAILGGDTFEAMAEYLNLDKNLLNYFSDANLFNFMMKLVGHKEIEVYRKDMKKHNTSDCSTEVISVMSPVAEVRQLVTLPEDYSDLINSVSLFTCRNNEREDSRNPTMCLVCGEILCSQTYCCQKELDKVGKVGSCTYHTEMCGAGAGIFLRMRDAEILLLGQNKGCFLSAPYLDDYGETDQGLRRGNPLHLCRESYKKLHLLWLSHGIHEEIARKTESQTHMYQVQWNHL